jgi:hypothetical protein
LAANSEELGQEAEIRQTCGFPRNAPFPADSGLRQADWHGPAWAEFFRRGLLLTALLP